jgi:dipeptidyl aminopeptidase/acylaminoacyl peptidase
MTEEVARHVAGVAGKRPVTQEDIWLMKRVGNPAASPDGTRLAVSVLSPAYDPAEEIWELWLLAADGKAPPRRLVRGPAPIGVPAWSPDGTRLAFSTRRERDAAAQIYVLPIDGGEAVRVTQWPGGARYPRWRPDGKAILFESDCAADGDPTPPKSSARIFDAMPVRHWIKWLDARRPHPLVIELAEGSQPRDLIKDTDLARSPGFRGTFRSTESDMIETLAAQWAPDGKSVVFAAHADADTMMHSATQTGLYQVTAGGGEPRRITDSAESFSEPQFARTGDALYALRRRRASDSTLTQLARFSWPKPGKPAIVTGSWDRLVSGFSISTDGRTAYLDALDDGFARVFKVPTAGGTVEPMMPTGQGAYRTVTPIEGGVAAIFERAIKPPEIVRLEGNRHVPLTGFNAERVAVIDAPDPQHFWFTSAAGRRIHNMLILPPSFDPRKKYPLVALIHGGPATAYTDAFSYGAFWFHKHLLATPGYVVLATNYMGSLGLGEEFAESIEKDVLRGPCTDILSGIDEAIRLHPFIDKDRLAAVGGSYGGYMVNWLSGATKRFKCFVSHVGPFNNEAQYGTNDGGLEREIRMGVPIWEKGGQWNDQSPIRYSQNFSTPTLVSHGERDFRVPLGEGLTHFKILQRRKIPSRFVVFPDEGHMVAHAENARVFWREVKAWLAKYL